MLASLERGVVVIDGLVHRRVLVGGHNERLALFGQDGAGTLLVRVDQSRDLETGTKLVLETEGVTGRESGDFQVGRGAGAWL